MTNYVNTVINAAKKPFFDVAVPFVIGTVVVALGKAFFK